MDKKIEISTRTVFYFLIGLASLWIFWELHTVFLILLAAFILALGLNPWVEKLERRGLPRSLAVFLLFFVGGILLFSVGAVGVPPLLEQTRHFTEKLPSLLSSLSHVPYGGELGQSLIQEATSVSRNIFQATLGVFSGTLVVVTILVFTFYLLLDLGRIRRGFFLVLPPSVCSEVKEFWFEAEEKLGAWLRGVLILMFVVGLATFFGLTFLGVPYPLPLSLIAGLLEIVPNLGPVLSTIPAALVGFTSSPVKGFLVIALFFLVQQVENNLLVPKVMQKTVGLNPLVTIMVILVGGKLFGFLGMVVAIPATLVFILGGRKFLGKKKSAGRE